MKKTVSKKKAKTMSTPATTAGSAGPSPQDYTAYSNALSLTRDAILLLDQELPLTIDSSVHDDLEAELLDIQRQRLALNGRFRAYQQNTGGFTPPDQAAIAKIKTLSDQVGGFNADQAQAQAILQVVTDVADIAPKLFSAIRN